MFFVYLDEIVGKKTLVKPTSRIIEGEDLMLTFFVRGGPSPAGGGRVVRWSWVNFRCRGVLQFGLQ